MTVNDLSNYLIENFHTMVDVKEDVNACWPFKGCKDKDGRGMVRNGKKRIRAPRVAILLSGRELPDDMYACHACDNPACCNPHHLWVGSPLANLLDAMAKGRHHGSLPLEVLLHKANITVEKEQKLLAAMENFYTTTATYQTTGGRR